MADIYKLNDLVDLLAKPGMDGVIELLEEELDNISKQIHIVERNALRAGLEEFTAKKFEVLELDGIRKGLKRAISKLDTEYVKTQIEKARSNKGNE